MIDLLATHPADLAPELLGWTIACRGAVAIITEVEANHQSEPAAHSYGGRPTPRTEGLFGPPGTAYVYVSYGIHLCANIVTGPAGSGEAVLLRAAVPVDGEALISERRGGRPTRELLTGPGRLAQGLGIQLTDTGRTIVRTTASAARTALADSLDGPVIWRDVELAARAGIRLPLTDEHILVGPRIGITKAVDLPWRFGISGAPLSRPFAAARRQP